MTDKELMQQALEALEKIAAYRPLTFAECSDAEAVMGIAENAIPALRERLAQPQRTHWEGCEEVHPECKKPGCAECGKGGGWALYCVACAEKLAQPEQAPVAHVTVAGALFDFMGWLTSRKKRLVLSSSAEASPAVEAIQEFAKMRGLSLADADVQNWQQALAAPQRRERLAQPEQREVEIEFKEWMHPQIGVVPVDSKTPLILKAHIREKNTT